MTTLAEMQDGIVGALRKVDGLTVGTWRKGDTLPYAVVTMPDLIGYHATFAPNSAWGNGGEQPGINFRVVLLVGASLQDEAVRTLLGYAEVEGAKSLYLALHHPEGDAFGLPDVRSFVDGFRVLGLDEQDAWQAYGGEFTVRIIARSGNAS